jgi:hypothetical protein
MLVGNQSCTVPQRTLENKNNVLNYECARPDRLKFYRYIKLYLGGRDLGISVEKTYGFGSMDDSITN